MPEVFERRIKQFRIFAPDVLPFVELSSGAGSAYFTKRFSFKDAGLVEDTPGELGFTGGVVAGDPLLYIPQLHIGQRRIVLDVKGDSDAGHRAYAAILEAFSEIAQSKVTEEPVVFTEESILIVKLDVDWERLLAPEFVALTHRAVSKFAGHELADAAVASLRLAVTYRFTPTNPLVRDYDVRLSEKALVLETRAQMPLEDRRFFSMFPGSSRDHLVALEELEKGLASPKGGKARQLRR